MRTLLSFAGLSALLLFSCKKSDNHTGGNPPMNCLPPDSANCAAVMCTADFRTITVRLQNNTGNAVILDSNYTQDAQGNKLPASYFDRNSVTEEVGVYTVITDAWTTYHRNTTVPLTFVGYKNGNKIIEQVFSIHTDCCHINKASGPSIITVSGNN